MACIEPNRADTPRNANLQSNFLADFPHCRQHIKVASSWYLLAYIKQQFPRSHKAHKTRGFMQNRPFDPSATGIIKQHANVLRNENTATKDIDVGNISQGLFAMWHSEKNLIELRIYLKRGSFVLFCEHVSISNCKVGIFNLPCLHRMLWTHWKMMKTSWNILEITTKMTKSEMCVGMFWVARNRYS